MAKWKSGDEEFDVHFASETSDTDGVETDCVQEAAPDNQDQIIATVAAVTVVAVGAVVFEAALLPGLALGVVAALAPRAFPNIGPAVAPMLRSAVRDAYRLGRRTRELVAEAQEQINDIVAEADAESRSKAAVADPVKEDAPAA